MTDTPTAAEIIDACDVLMRSRHYPVLAGLLDAKAEAEKELEAEQARDRILAETFCDALADLGYNHESPLGMVRAASIVSAIRAAVARTGDEQLVSEPPGTAEDSGPEDAKLGRAVLDSGIAYWTGIDFAVIGRSVRTGIASLGGRIEFAPQLPRGELIGFGNVERKDLESARIPQPYHFDSEERARLPLASGERVIAMILLPEVVPDGE